MKYRNPTVVFTWRRSIMLIACLFSSLRRGVAWQPVRGRFEAKLAVRGLSRVPVSQQAPIVRRQLSSDSSDASSSESSTLLEQYENKANRRDQVFSAISGDGGIKVTAATVRNIVNDIMLQHTLTPTPADALGRTITCALLMANGIQAEQIVQITMNGRYKITFGI